MNNNNTLKNVILYLHIFLYNACFFLSHLKNVKHYQNKFACHFKNGIMVNLL